MTEKKRGFEPPKYDIIRSYHTGSAILQMKFLKPAHRDNKDREGTVLLEIAPRSGIKEPGRWDEKISFSLTYDDICKLMTDHEKPSSTPDGKDGGADIFHKFGDSSKSLKVKEGKNKDGSFFWMLSESSPRGKKSHYIALNESQMWGVKNLLSEMAVSLLGW